MLKELVIIKWNIVIILFKHYYIVWIHKATPNDSVLECNPSFRCLDNLLLGGLSSIFITIDDLKLTVVLWKVSISAFHRRINCSRYHT